MPIPKKIHYVWLGDKPLPERDARFIEGWKKLNPGWEVIHHTERDIDLKRFPLVAKALSEKRWALASDVIRMYVVYEQGGVYMDTDVELLRGLSFVTKYDGFGAYENKYWFTTSVFGARAGSPWIGKILKRYKITDASKRITTDTFLKTVHSPSVYAKDIYGITTDGRTREYAGGKFATFAPEVFAPKHYMTGRLHKTEKTVAVHHYASTWHNKVEKAKADVAKATRRAVGERGYERFERAYARRLERLIRKELP